MTPIMNKLIRVTNKRAATIDHILTNSYAETIFQAAILKCDVLDHFPTFLIVQSLKFSSRNKVIYITKDHLMNNLLSTLKRNFLKLIGKKLKFTKFT